MSGDVRTFFENPLDAEDGGGSGDEEAGAGIVTRQLATTAEHAVERTAGKVQVTAGGGLEAPDTEATAEKISSFGKALGMEGIGSIGAQAYLIVGFFSNFSLLTMMTEIDWPTGWLALFGWPRLLAFPLKILMPFDLMVEDVELGETLTIVATLSIHPLIVAYAAYRRSFFSSGERKDNWATAAEKSWWWRVLLWLALWIVPPVLLEVDRMSTAAADDEESAISDEATISHIASMFTVLWLFGVGVLVVPFVLYRTALRSAYRTSQTRNEPKENFFGGWAQAEGSVLLFAYITMHLSVIVVCIKWVASNVGQCDTCRGSESGVGAMFVMFCGPIYAFAVPMVLVINLRRGKTERKVAKWIKENNRDQLDGDARAKAIEDIVAQEVGYGDQRSMNAALYSLVAPFEQNFSKLKIGMMIEKILLGTFVVGMQGEAQIWGSLSVSAVGTIFYLWKQPMLDSGEDVTECSARLSNTIVVLTGSLAQYTVINKAVGEGILMTVSTATLVLFVVTLGPRRAVRALTAFCQKQGALQKAAGMSEEYIRESMSDDEVLKVDDTMWANLSADQQGWLLWHRGSQLVQSKTLELAVQGVVQVGTLSLPIRTTYESTTLDASGKVDNAALARMLAWWLGTAGAAEVTSTDFRNNPLTSDGVSELIKAFEETPHIRTLCGLEEGVQHIDWKYSGKAATDVALLSAELQAARACAGLTSVCLLGTEIGDEAMVQLLEALKDFSLTSLDISKTGCGVPTTASKLAELLSGATKFSTVLNSLTVDSTGDTKEVNGGPKTYTLTGGQKNIELIGKNLGSEDVALLTAWLQRPEVSATLTSLSLGSNPVGDEAMVGLLEVLKDASLTSLDIQSTGCGVPTASKLAEVLSGATKFSAGFTRLLLGSNPQIGNEAMVQLLEALKDVSLTSLDISKTGCVVSATGKLAELLSGATKFSATVADLNISMNPIGVDGAKALGDVIPGSSLACLIIGPKGTRLAVNNEQVTELNFEGQEFGPAEATLVAAATSTLAALTRACLLNNPLGEGVNDIIKVFEETPRLRTLCGFEEGVQQIDWKDSGKGVADVALLSAELKACRAVAAVNSLTLDSNGIFGELYSTGRVKEVDKFVADCDAFLAALKESNIVTLSLQKTGLGPLTLRKLATSLPAKVKSIDLSGCGLTGATWSTKNHYGGWQKIDSNMDGFIALCAVLGKVRTVRLADCGLGAGYILVTASSVAELSKIFSDPTATLTEIDVRNNRPQLDDKAVAALRAAAPKTCEILAD